MKQTFTISKNLFWVLCLLLGVMLSYAASPPPNTISSTLRQSWSFYKDRFMVNQERVESNNYGGTITEGQSYAMLKAVWMNDPTIFARTWAWTRTHMNRPKDHLLGWRWGKRPNGTWGLLEIENATDADQDIAYALLLAGEKWKAPLYLQQGKAMIQDIWKLNVTSIRGKYYLTPGTWKGFRQEYLTVDPSYFAPYVYRKFAQYDRSHAKGWLLLASQTYPTLEACSNLTANKLPPNWCGVRWNNNQIIFSDAQGPGSRNFQYDAFRVFWRMSMDAALGSPSAEAYLQRHRYLQTYWEKAHTLPEGFSETGTGLGNAPSGFALSTALAQRARLYPKANRFGLYQAMLGSYYHPEGYWFNDYNDFLHSVIWLHLYTLTLK